MILHILWSIVVLFPISTSNAQPAERMPGEDLIALKTRQEYVSRISCDRDKPDFVLPKFDDWDPNLATPQEICTLSRDGLEETILYWGQNHFFGYRYQSFQGFCEQIVLLTAQPDKRLIYRQGALGGLLNVQDEISIDGLRSRVPYPGVAFAQRLPGRHNLLQNPRVALYCREHCYCKYLQPVRTLYDPLIEATERPKGYPSDFGIRLVPAHRTHRISIDRRKFGDVFTDRSDTTLVESTRILYGRPFVADQSLVPAPDSIFISLDPRNKIVCRQIPISEIVPIPSPYTRDDYPDNDLRKLCATELSGGDSGANAGGYCHHPTRGSTPPGEVWFSDTVTPRPEWRFAYDFRTALQIRHFCWENCWCADQEGPPATGSRMVEVWNILDTLEFITTRYGPSIIAPIPTKSSQGKDLGVKQGEDVSKSHQLRPDSVIVTPAEWNGKPVSKRTCVIRRVDYCKPEPWPVDILGPIPNTSDSLDDEDGDEEPDDLVKHMQENSEESANPDWIANDIPLCGRICSGPALTTCSGGQEEGCQCTVAPLLFAKLLNLDPVAPVALCLNLLALSAARSQSKGSASWSFLGGRSLEQYDEELAELPEAACPCNVSYVSRGCCGSEFGLIWEDPALKIGELAALGELKTKD